MKTILQKLQEDGTFINATCNGSKTCGKCKIQMYNQNIPPTKQEQQLLTNQEIKQGVRLACCNEYQKNSKYKVVEDNKMQIEAGIQLQAPPRYVYRGDYGIIVDIGTTTIVMKWISMQDGSIQETEAFVNPQGVYGSDVITRIQYTKENPHLLHHIVITNMEKYLNKYKQYRITKMLVCGNTTMTHLFLDKETTSLGVTPFIVPEEKMQRFKSEVLFKNIPASFEVITLPHISAYVGGDIVSGILASNIDQEKSIKMLIDLGTNGELVVGNVTKILATSCAAGPAFEGGGIQCGGPSIPGAIYKVKIEDGHISYRTIKDKEATCICGSGLISLIAELKRHQVIDELGRFTMGIKQFYITDTIFISMADIQNFQLAKAAIQTGIQVLLQETKDLNQIYISGGFGSTLEVNDLVTIKLIPNQYQHMVTNIKNSALSGVYLTLMSDDYQRINEVIEKTSYINLASYSNFEDMLVDGLYF